MLNSHQKAYEDGRVTGQEEGFALGAYQKALETTRTMLILGIPLEHIQFCTCLPLETVQRLAQEL